MYLPSRCDDGLSRRLPPLPADVRPTRRCPSSVLRRPARATAWPAPNGACWRSCTSSANSRRRRPRRRSRSAHNPPSPTPSAASSIAEPRHPYDRAPMTSVSGSSRSRRPAHNSPTSLDHRGQPHSRHEALLADAERSLDTVVAAAALTCSVAVESRLRATQTNQPEATHAG